jgi:hypothetical protein
MRTRDKRKTQARPAKERTKLNKPEGANEQFNKHQHQRSNKRRMKKEKKPAKQKENNFLHTLYQ